MDLQHVLNSQQAGLWALRICRIFPPSIGIPFSRLVADQIALRKNLPLVKAIRLNRWVASDCRLNRLELDRAVRENLRHIAGSYYILFHYLDRPEMFQRSVRYSPSVEDMISKSRDSQRGMVVAGIHISNFDLVVQTAPWQGLEVAAISLPTTSEYHEAVEWQHHFRRAAGLEIFPASFSSFRLAIQRLKNGGIILTGVDRPVPNPRLKPLFFGRPASLPVHYITMALEASVPLVLFATLRQPDGTYHIYSSEEISMQSFSDRRKTLLFNAEQVLERAADFIGQAPEQWNVFLPIWPDVQDELP
jgi:lauroyl/myristoyl acyltransferase